MIFVDTYISSYSKSSIENLCSQYCNHLPIMKGRVARQEYIDGDIVIPSVPQIGDPDKWYSSIRCIENITLPSDVTICDEAVGIALCGVWSNGKEF